MAIPPEPGVAARVPRVVEELLGGLGCVLLQPARLLVRRPRTEPRRILLIELGGIAEVQLLTPAARHLRARYPDAALTLLTPERNAEFARGLGVVDEVLCLDFRPASRPRTLVRRALLLGRVRALRFDVVVDFEPLSRFSAALTAASGAAARLGFRSPSRWRGGFHTRELALDPSWPVARNFRALADGEDGTEVASEDFVPFRLTRADHQSMRVFLAERGGLGGGPILALDADAGSARAHSWRAERFAALAGRLMDEDDARVVFVGSHAEAGATAEVVAAVGPRRAGSLLDLSGGLDVRELCALLAEVDGVVSNDSGPAHVAAAFGTPTVGLFGARVPMDDSLVGAHTRGLDANRSIGEVLVALRDVLGRTPVPPLPASSAPSEPRQLGTA